MTIKLFFLLGLLILCVRALSTNKGRLLLIFVVFAPFSYFAINLGVVLSPAKFIAIIIFLFWIFSNNGNLVRSSLLNKLYTYWIYLIFSTLFLSSFWPEYNTFNQGVFYTASFRGIVQIFLLTIQVITITIFVQYSTSIDLNRVMTNYCWVLLFICVYGVYIYVAQRFNLPFSGINRQGRGESGTAVSFVFAEGRIFRAYSLTGEPKQLAVDSLIGLVLWYKYYFRLHKNRSYLLQVFVYATFVSSLYLTYSTSGYIIAIFLAGSLLVFSITHLKKLIPQILGVFVVIMALFSSSANLSERIFSIFEHRVNDRLEEQSITGYAEDAALNVLNKYPVFVITGVGLGGSSFYVREENRTQYAGYTAAPRGLIGILLDQGLIGLFLLGRVIYSAYFKVKHIKSETPSIKMWKDLLLSLLISLTIFLVTITHWYLFIGIFSLVFIGIDKLSYDNN